MNTVLLYLTHYLKTNYLQIYKNLLRPNQIEIESLKKVESEYFIQKIEFFTIFDVFYPKSLLICKNVPMVFFYKGDLSILEKYSKVYLINEIQNVQTEEILNDIILKNKKNCAFVLCGYKQERDLEEKLKANNCKIIYFCASGLDQINHLEKDNPNYFFISPFPIKTHPKKEYFYINNFLAAAFANSLIFISSEKESKANNLVNCFLNLGKEIYCFPAQNLEDGNNELIKSGANLITKIEEAIKNNP
ncbi:DNA-processing protein DprA [Mycoplasmopsis gallinacea]|uniref:DNA processing protein n=1 Tax=Mycoplasmopsis gallinacea TaxID=29556 RepID=A0A449A2P4_9BACT|nr:DNA-processing protein DprA [Mycoplasmopsis gallinacea]VEU58482.1 Putative DNA processing protein [Mycoplasmopsis gallinacea]